MRDNSGNPESGGKFHAAHSCFATGPEGGFSALNPETGSTSQGDTVEEALANLREATELFVEEFPLSVSSQSLVTTFEVAVRA